MDSANYKRAEHSILLFYQHFYAATLYYSNYKFVPTQRQLVSLNKFIHTLDKRYNLLSLNNDFFFRYFAFQFQCRETQYTRFNGKVMFGWTVGPKALERWIDKDSSYWHFCTQGILKKYEIKVDDIVNRPTLFTEFVDLTDSEEIEKQRFYGTPEGFSNCIDNTTLYNAVSSLCNNCKYHTACKDMIKQVYPKIASKRDVATV